MASTRSRALLSLTLFFSTCGIVGSIMNQKVSAQQASEESTLRDSLHQFTDAYSVVEQNYADPLTNDKIDKAIYDGAIPNMLHMLDPHSSFYDPKAFAQMREDQRGKYYGVGMSIQPQMIGGVQRIVVMSPFEGTPSYKAGIRPGDIISKVDGKSTDGMDSLAVSLMLRGAKGTPVHVSIVREGQPKPLEFDLVRAEIPRNSVDLAYMIKPGIGYIHVTQFMETTSKEVGEALDHFGPINGLLIDLRSNPGGLVNEAVAMADKFLQRGQVVVSQKGRSFQDQVYRANHGSDGKQYPIVVLVNRNTASAAEIVSGALQDHDRALIVGETTFGKGLVQTVYQTPDNTGLALTTFHYYTPSGRLIQRSYDNVSLYDYYFVRDTAKKADKSNTEVKLTDAGRTVYGGGGITPDKTIDIPKYTPFQTTLLQNQAFFKFSAHYLSTRTVDKNFNVDDAVLQEFKAWLKTNNIAYTEADFNKDKDWVRSSLKAEVISSQFGQQEGMRIRADNDPTIAKALSYMPEAQALEEQLKASQQQQHTASLR
ncbi:MAG: S41 family peptidase [Acidobacteria bacterium]|nr:S41 family peptidase [Acidobacteriota bacterium]